MPMFTKPKDVRYVDMAIWVDEHAYEEDCDSETLYEYLYHLAGMLAYKRALCNSSQEYDDFATYSASKYFLRLTDKRQYSDDISQRLAKIKSILNFMKKTIYVTKLDFDKECSKSFVPQNVVKNLREESLRSILDNAVDGISIAEFEVYLHDIAKTIREYISRIPYVSDPVVFNNIYTSCLLSFINSMTLGRRDIERIKHMEKTSRLKPFMIDNMYYEERRKSTILLHLDESMRDYITVLVNGMRKTLANDLSSILHTNVTASAYARGVVQTDSTEADE